MWFNVQWGLTYSNWEEYNKQIWNPKGLFVYSRYKKSYGKQ